MKSQVWLVFEREFLTRVQRKSFILVTLLTPLAFLLFFVVAGLIFSYQSDDKSQILVLDPSGILAEQGVELRRFEFQYFSGTEEELKEKILVDQLDGGLYLPSISDNSGEAYEFTFLSDEPLDIESTTMLNRSIRSQLRSFRMQALNLDDAVLESLDVEAVLSQQPLTNSGKKVNSMTGVVAAAIGGIMGYIMFFVIIFFGTQVMRSVTEEKTNRIVEVIISSVRPFDLMLGKILGSSGVSLLQLLIWIVLIPLVAWVGQGLIPFDLSNPQGMGTNAQLPEGMENLPLVIEQLTEVNWWMIVPLFLLYFVSGFLIYSSLFAAIGAALGDDINEGQALTIPVVIPIVLAMYIMFQVIREPHSSLAVWSSIFPFFSSIVMTTRLAFEPPIWQIAISLIATIGTAFLMIWLAGRIYRVGILLYGKKANYREMAKWIFSRK